MLGKGMFGETYEAFKGNERVAIKLIKEEAILFGFDLRRFQREVRALQKAVGPNVVRFIDSGTAKFGNTTRYYVAMEYLDGTDLHKAFQEANYEFEEVLLKNILCQVIDGLKTVHAQNIIHRDLKPANIFLTAEGQVKLLDFGLVKMLDYTTLTSIPGQAIGTHCYIAPEILRGGDVDQRADFYSLGVMIYHLVTQGAFPFEARTELELFGKVVNNPPTPPTRHNPKLSSEFENLILTLLEKQPYERMLDHDELIEAIRATPMTLPKSSRILARERKKEYPKRCFFRLMQNEKSVTVDFVRKGGKIDGLVYPANFLPSHRKTLSEFQDNNIPFIFDPGTSRLPYSSFAKTKGLVALPYVFDKNSVLTATSLQSLRDQQAYVKTCLDFQLKWGCADLVAPFHFCRNLGSEWMDIDIKLIEESLAYAQRTASRKKVYAGLALNIEAYTNDTNRQTLLTRYSRAKANGFLFYVDAINEKTDNRLQLYSYLNLLKLFQRLGKPVFACRVGSLGLGMLAAGVDGITNGIASLTSFSEKGLLLDRAIGYDMSPKYYIPELMSCLSVKMAEDILNNKPEYQCNCPYCSISPSSLDRASKPHFLQKRTEEISEINSLSSNLERIQWFCERVKSAIKAWRNLKKYGIDVNPYHYRHLETWLEVFII
ncbi:hypothetical protein CEE36_08605 [candidate division TA06 bacterium B3_TA06]|uniref:non-specific serine/threonine protein kinase n=1 Tax=candidate division TA06 bacterium B3_TA06 TaxID=2012487 RepID=A0A532V2F4_UNCT6|nr:MAG: hypothetical protein CEE36_08605 [candidate division TA06 bacterium B3_TA06]